MGQREWEVYWGECYHHGHWEQDGACYPWCPLLRVDSRTTKVISTSNKKQVRTIFLYEFCTFVCWMMTSLSWSIVWEIEGVCITWFGFNSCMAHVFKSYGIISYSKLSSWLGFRVILAMFFLFSIRLWVSMMCWMYFINPWWNLYWSTREVLPNITMCRIASLRMQHVS